MKILRLLNKASLPILISLFFFQSSYATEPVDIWNIKEDYKDGNLPKLNKERKFGIELKSVIIEQMKVTQMIGMMQLLYQITIKDF